MSSQSSRSCGSRAPQPTAIALAVVGRRTATSANAVPLTALNRLDLPDPVAPAKAITVWPPVNEIRSPARSTTASASATIRASARPSAARAASPSARSRSAKRSVIAQPWRSWVAPADDVGGRERGLVDLGEGGQNLAGLFGTGVDGVDRLQIAGQFESE